MIRNPPTEVVLHLHMSNEEASANSASSSFEGLFSSFRTKETVRPPSPGALAVVALWTCHRLHPSSRTFPVIPWRSTHLDLVYSTPKLGQGGFHITKTAMHMPSTKETSTAAKQLNPQTSWVPHSWVPHHVHYRAQLLNIASPQTTRSL